MIFKFTQFPAFIATFSHHPPPSVLTLPPSLLHSSPTIKHFSRWFWVQQQQSMMWALLEQAHTHITGGICLWMDRQMPLPRQLQLTEAGGTESHWSKRKNKKNKAVTPGGQSCICKFVGIILPLLEMDSIEKNQAKTLSCNDKAVSRFLKVKL